MISPEDKKALDELNEAFKGIALPEIEGVEIPEEIKIRELSKGESASELATTDSGSSDTKDLQDLQTRLLEGILESLAMANSHLEIMSRVIGNP